MDNDSSQGDDGRSSRRGRFMGKLFGKEPKDRKANDAKSAASLDAFLHSSQDNLQIKHPPPPPPPATSIPKLTKLDTTITRYPQALAVNHQAQQNRPVAPGQFEASRLVTHTPRPNKKGLVVRFTDAYPDIIGEGGDESEIPVIEITNRKKTHPPPVSLRNKPPPASPNPPGAPSYSRLPPEEDDFQPKPMLRTQTGYSSIYEPEPDHDVAPPQAPPRSNARETIVPGRAAPARFLETTGRRDENRRSFIEIHQAEMRQAEGKAFAQAARTNSSANNRNWEEDHRPVHDAKSDPSPPTMQAATPIESQAPYPPLQYSPAGSISTLASSSPSMGRSNTVGSQVQGSWGNEYTAATPSATTPMRQDSASGAADLALTAFVKRTTHLFELFRLHAETSKPLQSCSLENCSRASLWWFLKGRMGLETAVRERPNSAQAQRQNELDRQQAFTNLAKGFWISEEAIPEIAESQRQPPDGQVIETAQSLMSGLKKLAMSMQRNGFLPPEEPFLPQTLDKSIWVEYPAVSQDMVALLTGNWGASMTALQHPMSTLRLLDAFPVSDSQENFSYGRVNADTFLMEQGREAQRLHFPCLLSIVRPQQHTGLVFVIASQNGAVQLAVQDNKKGGPVWDDVRWRNENCTLNIKLPRGFVLVIQLVQQDYRMLCNMYEFGSKVRSTMFPRKDERVVFRNVLRSFQYMDADPQSRTFPKEPVAQCDVALFEKVHQENGPSGQRIWHRGFRIAVVTGPRTRTLSGTHHTYLPTQPIEFGFFRADSEAPALSLKFENGRPKGRMVLIFNDEKERLHFHSLLVGTALNHDEKIFTDVPVKSFRVSQSIREPTGLAPFSRMPWKSGRVINEEFNSEGDGPSTVLADRLRLVLEYQNGTITDRVNVAPGELRVRLDVSNAKVFRIMRQPQQDLTVSVSEAQVPKELPRNLSDALQLLQNNQTIRTVEFGSLDELHAFQAALTGFEVIFDALASTFAIARRRMVVPIHKKWEASYTRIQVVRREDKQLQLLAFFEDFHHGHCMNFVLKGTDVYECFGKGAKSGVKFVDAKFPLPRVPEDKDGDYDDMAFVCLDLPDLPGEHDDISVVFEKEADRDKLIQCLPAPVKGLSKLVSRLK